MRWLRGTYAETRLSSPRKGDSIKERRVGGPFANGMTTMTRMPGKWLREGTATSQGTARDVPVEALIRRIQAEFAEMPGLLLTKQQAARLWALDTERCDVALLLLVQSGFLVRRASGQYGRPRPL